MDEPWRIKQHIMKTISKIIFALVTLMPLSAISHPGHGNGNPLSPSHYTSSPEHAVPIALTISALVVVLMWVTNKRKDSAR